MNGEKSFEGEDTSLSEESSEKRSFTEIEKGFQERGFTFAGMESLTKIELDEKSIRFVAVPSRTKEEVIQEYSDKFKNVDVEVELVDVGGLSEKQKAVYVFIKSKE